jgi:hypothetical protein
MTNTLNTLHFWAASGQLSNLEQTDTTIQKKDLRDNWFNISEYLMFDKPDRT